MHPPQIRQRANQLRADGVSFGEICRALGLPRRTVGNWFHGERARRRRLREANPSRPGLIAAADDAMRCVMAKSVHRVVRDGCVVVESSAKHWPCVLPQHGPGKKHERHIEWEGWQRDIVAEFPDRFLRGLFHSDGCRVINRVTRGGRTYCYPRYMFSNESADIMRLCQESLDRLGVPWRMCRRNLLSVARREGVAILDVLVGPKW